MSGGISRQMSSMGEVKERQTRITPESSRPPKEADDHQYTWQYDPLRYSPLCRPEKGYQGKRWLVDATFALNGAIGIGRRRYLIVFPLAPRLVRDLRAHGPAQAVKTELNLAS